MEDLQGKVAVVTGAASGIGLALTKTFLGQGMKVVMADIEEGALDVAIAGLEPGAEVLPVRCDVSVASSVDAVRDAALATYGAVHVVCNNAGVGGGGLTWAQSAEDWDWVLGVNLRGVINGITTFTPLLIEQGEGHIVNTASIAGLTSAPFMSAYNVSKHGVVTLSETLWADLQVTGNTNIGVSVLCPGWVQTRIHESHRNRPTSGAGGPGEITDEQKMLTEVVGGLIAEGLNPLQVAGMVLDAVHQGRFYILTHTSWTPMISDRVDRIVHGEMPAVAALPQNSVADGA